MAGVSHRRPAGQVATTLPHPPGGPVGSGHSLEAARVGLCLVLESDPHVWGLSVGPTLARVALTDQPQNRRLPHLRSPWSQGPS